MHAYVAGIGIAGPGLDGWTASMPVLSGRTPFSAAPIHIAVSSLLPAAERRRASVPVRLALAVGSEALAQAGFDAARAATVFASSAGDGENLHQICETLASEDRAISPTRFHNSVHNAPAGYWGIATRSHEASTSLGGYDSSFGAGLLEAAGQVAASPAPVALIAYDQPYPEPLHTARPVTACFGVALVLTDVPSDASVAQLDIDFVAGTVQVTHMNDPGLEALRAGVPAARSLPLLAVLARQQAGSVVMECSGGHLTIRVTPCD